MEGEKKEVGFESPQHQFCVVLQTFMNIRRQCFGEQFPILRHYCKKLSKKMKTKRYAKVCNMMWKTMRPIMERLKKENGDETLLDYARTNRVDLFEWTCFVQVYHSLTDEERENMWRVFAQLASLVGVGYMASNRLFSGVTSIAHNIARGTDMDEIKMDNPMANIGLVLKSIVNSTELTNELRPTFETMLCPENTDETTTMMLDLVEGSGLVSYAQRTRAEEKKQQRDMKESVKIHTGKNDNDGEWLNAIAAQMLQNEVMTSDVTQLVSKMTTAEEQTAKMHKAIAAKPERDLGDIIADVMTNVPRHSSGVKGVNQIFEVLTSTTAEGQQFKQSIVETAQKIANGDASGVFGGLQNMVTAMKKDVIAGEGDHTLPNEDNGTEFISQMQNIMQGLGGSEDSDMMRKLQQFNSLHMEDAPFNA